MLSFKQFLLYEHLTDQEREILSTIKPKDFDMTHANSIWNRFYPEGQNHIELAVDSPLTSEIKSHLASKPITDQNRNAIGTWRLSDDGVTAVHPTDSRKTRPVSSLIKDNPALLKKFSDAQAKAGERGEVSDTSNKKIVITNHHDAVTGMSSDAKPFSSCAKIIDGNPDVAFGNLYGHLSSGGGVAYLVNKDEPTPTDPQTARGRIALYPFVSRKGHTILRPAKLYGEDDVHGNFQHTVHNWCEEHFPIRDEEYHLHPDVYQNDFGKRRTIYNKTEIERMKKEFDEKLKTGDVSHEDIENAHFHGYLRDDHLPALTKAINKKIDSGDFTAKDIHQSHDLKYFNEETRNKLSNHLENKINSGNFDENDLSLGYQYNYLNKHKNKLSNILHKKIDSGLFNSNDLNMGKMYGYLDNNHLTKLGDGLTRDISIGTFKPEDIEDANKFGYLKLNHVAKLSFDSNHKAKMGNHLHEKLNNGTVNLSDIDLAHKINSINGGHRDKIIANKERLSDQLARKIRSKRFTNHDINLAKKYGYYDENLHGENV